MNKNRFINQGAAALSATAPLHLFHISCKYPFHHDLRHLLYRLGITVPCPFHEDTEKSIGKVVALVGVNGLPGVAVGHDDLIS